MEDVRVCGGTVPCVSAVSEGSLRVQCGEIEGEGVDEVLTETGGGVTEEEEAQEARPGGEPHGHIPATGLHHRHLQERGIRNDGAGPPDPRTPGAQKRPRVLHLLYA